MMVHHVIRSLCVFVSIQCCLSAKILGIFNMPAPSHYILGSALMKGLAERGHDVTMISSYGEKNVPKHWKYRDIVLTDLAKEFEVKKKDMFNHADSNPLLGIFAFAFTGSNIVETTLNDSALQELLKSDEKFDVVILENFFSDALKALAPSYGASLVLFCTVGSNSWINPVVGNPSNPAYIPDLLVGYPPKMNLWQRLYNTIFLVLSTLVDHAIYYPGQKKIMKKYFKDVTDKIDVDEIIYNVSFVLLNSHVSISQPVPHTPNMVEIGGFHISPPEPLPKDLQNFLDSANEGVIYFSMGSNLKSKYLPDEKREAILKTFAKLKQKVLWKWEDEVLPGKPSNVMVKKWFPQQSILAHPNVKLFITHGGLLSTTETIYHGVPVLAIPIFGDQEANAAKAVTGGYGVKVSFLDLNEETLTTAINEVLRNPKYAENAKTRSKLMHDRPMKPLDEAIYWVEYVIRHKGATHFRSAALDLAWYQYLLLDVFAIIILAIITFVYIVKYMIRLICRKSKKDKLKKS